MWFVWMMMPSCLVLEGSQPGWWCWFLVPTTSCCRTLGKQRYPITWGVRTIRLTWKHWDWFHATYLPTYLPTATVEVIIVIESDVYDAIVHLINEWMIMIVCTLVVHILQEWYSWPVSPYILLCIHHPPNHHHHHHQLYVPPSSSSSWRVESETTM